MRHSLPCICLQNQISHTRSYLCDSSRRGQEGGGMPKFDGISTMKRTSFLLLESCKVEGNLLITSKIVQIMRNAHKEFLIHTFENISFNSSNWKGHEPEATLVATMSSQERLQFEMVSYMRVSSLLGSSMGFGMGFWGISKLGFASIFKSRLLRWII